MSDNGEMAVLTEEQRDIARNSDCRNADEEGAVILATPVPEAAYPVFFDQSGETIKALYSDGVTRPVKEKKVAILGRAPASLKHTPYDDRSWDIVGLSNAACADQMPRWTRWYELHPLATGKQRWPKQFWEWLTHDHGKPIYLGEHDDAIPNGHVFPWDELTSRFGTYFNNSISLMMAHEIMLGATHLWIIGVDMAQTDPALHKGTAEYQHQRPSCEFMVGIARGMGVKCDIPIESDLMKSVALYAKEGDDNSLMHKCLARRKEMNKNVQKISGEIMFSEEQLGQCMAACAKTEGKMEVLTEQYNAKELSEKGVALLEKLGRDQHFLFENVKQAKYALQSARDNKERFKGALDDNGFWMTRVQA